MNTSISISIIKLYLSYFSLNELKLYENKISNCVVSDKNYLTMNFNPQMSNNDPTAKRSKVLIESHQSKKGLLKMIDSYIKNFNCKYKGLEQ